MVGNGERVREKNRAKGDRSGRQGCAQAGSGTD